MAIKVNGTTVVNNDRKGEFNVTNPGQFTTAQRDALTPVIGDTIYNTEESALQIWDGTEWGSAGGADETKAPVIFSATLTDDNQTNDTRFTDENFTVDITMAEEGVPVSTKGVKGVVTAEFSTYPATEACTDVTSSDTAGSRTIVSISGNTEITLNQYRTPSWLSVYDKNLDRSRCYLFLLNHDQPSQVWEFNNPASPADNYQVGNTNGNVQTAPMFWFQNKDYLNVWSLGSSYSYSFDKEQWLNGSFNPSTAVYCYFSSNNFDYQVTVSTNDNPNSCVFYRKAKGDQNYDYLGRRYFNGVDSYTSANSFGFECKSDSVLLLARSNSTGMVYLRVDEAWINGQNWDQDGVVYMSLNYTSVMSRNDSRYGCCIHKGSLYIGTGNGIIRFDPNGTPQATNSPPLQSGATWQKYQVFIHPGDETWLYCNTTDSTHTFRHYKSNNQGGTWIETGVPSSNTGQSQSGNLMSFAWAGTEMNIEDSTRGNGYSQAYWQPLGYQDVVVPNGADLAQINVGDSVLPSSAPRPNTNGQELYISQITDNGDGTTTIRVRGFGTVQVGDTLETLNATGTQIQNRYLVLDVLGNVTNTQTSDPGFTNIGPGGSFTMKFPSTFPTGNTPDEELLEGTSIKAEVQATNVAATSSTVTNALVPGTTLPKFGCTGFSFSPGDADIPAITWYNDSKEDISATPANLIDTVWKELYPWQNKTIYQTEQSFFAWKLKNNIRRSVTFDFSGEDLENKILEIHVYCVFASSGYSQYSYVHNLTGCTVYNNETLEWNSPGSSGKRHRLLLQDVTDVQLTVDFYTNGTNSQTSEYMAVTAYRLTDINGNEIPTEL